MRPYKRKRRGDFRSQTETPPPTQGEPAEADIPQLKKEEKERKGAGVPAWTGSGSGPGGMALGTSAARIGSSGLVSSPGFLGSGRIAAALARALGGPGTALGGLFASKAGSSLVLGGMLAWGGLMAAAGLKLFGGWGAAPQQGGGIYVPDMSSSGIVIDKPKDRSLGYLAKANEGELVWEKDAPAEEPEAEPEEEPVEDPGAEEPPPFEMPDVNALMAGQGVKKGLDRNSFISKMTQDPGALHGGRLQAGTAGFNLKKTFNNKLPKAAQLGKTKAMRRARKKISARGKRTISGKAGRAMGQLKLAKNMSARGAMTAADQGARQFETDAFEQGKTIGGEMAGIGGDGLTVPLNEGAGITEGVPDVDDGYNATPYQGNVDAAKAMDNSSAGLKNAGIMLIMAGLAMIAAGIALLNCTTFPIGWALIGAGTAMVLMGMMLLGMSANMAQGAKDQGKQIEDGYGQNDQGQVVDECADQATGGGIKADQCTPSQTNEEFQEKTTNTELHKAIIQERDATYNNGDGEQGGEGNWTSSHEKVKQEPTAK